MGVGSGDNENKIQIMRKMRSLAEITTVLLALVKLGMFMKLNTMKLYFSNSYFLNPITTRGGF